MKNTIIIIAAALMTGCAIVRPNLSRDPRDPSWQEMAMFLGVNKDNEAVVSFADKYGLKESTKGTEW